MAGKFILKEAVEELLPCSIVYRKKMGFPTPWEYWLAERLLDDPEPMLLEPRSTEWGLFCVEEIQRLFAEHRSKTRRHGNHILGLLNLEIWLRVMIDGEAVEAASAGGGARKRGVLS